MSLAGGFFRLLLVVAVLASTTQASLLAIDVERCPLVWPNGATTHARYPCVNIEVGTPLQPLKMLLAINVGDIAVVSQQTSVCGPSAGADSSCAWGLYDQNASTTFELQPSQNLTHGSLSWGDGFVIKDLVTVGNRSFPDMTVVVQDGSENAVGWFGIGGYPGEELVTSQYSNLPILLNQQKVTSIVGYSLYLPRINATDLGRVVFGGVETTKFTGTLESLSIPPNSGSLTQGNITATVSNMSISGHGTETMIADTTNITVIFDLADPGIGLPLPALQQLLSLLGLTEAQNLTIATGLVDGYKGIVVPYSTLRNETIINLQFKTTSIEIPVWDMLLPHNISHGFVPLYESLEHSGTYDSAGSSLIVGSSFFSNAYSVFDFSHNQLSIAPLRHVALSDDNVTPISDSGVSGLVGHGSSASSTDLSTGAKAGIGAGVGVGALLVIGAVLFFFYRRRRRSRQVRETGPTDHINSYIKSLMYSNHLGGKAELSAGPHETSKRGYSPAPLTQENDLLEMEGQGKPMMSMQSEEMKRVKRKPVAPQELP